MSKRLAIILWFLIATFAFGQGQDSIRAVGGVLTINLVPSTTRYKVFVDQAITSTVFTNPIPAAVITVLFVQDSTGHTVAFGGNISGSCTVGSTASATTACQFTFDSANNAWTGVGGGGGGGSIGAAINVKSSPYNAIGNGKKFVDGVTNGSNNQLTSATITFTASDLNQNVSCVSGALSAGAALKINSTVASFVNSSTITYSGANVGALASLECALTNPADPAAILSAFNACKSSFNYVSGGIPYQNLACNIYLPAGIYGLGQTLDNLIVTAQEGCVGIIGDGMTKSVLIPTGSFVAAVHGSGGVIINDRCAGPHLKDFSVDLASIPINPNSQAGFIMLNGTFAFLENVGVYDECDNSSTLFGIAAEGGTNMMFIHPTVISGNCTGNGGLVLNNVSNATVIEPFLSNTPLNLLVQNATSGANGAGIVFDGGVVDEGGIPSVQTSVDVWFNGLTLTGGANCLTVDATSFVWMTGGYCGTFGGSNGGGPTVASGGVLNMTQVHVNAIGAGNSCYTSAAYGGIVDDGTNRCTTSSSGTVYPAGGFTNKTSLSHLPFNAFQTGTLAATTNLQTFVVDQPVQIQTFSWTPNNAFACTAGSFPTFSMSDGTVTVTTAATDTSASGTVTHTFANTTASVLNPSGTVGAVLTVKVVTTGTCGTAPTNVNINIWGQATAPGV